MKKADLAPLWAIILVAPLQLAMLLLLIIAMVALTWEAWDEPDYAQEDLVHDYPPELFSPTDYEHNERR